MRTIKSVRAFRTTFLLTLAFGLLVFSDGNAQTVGNSEFSEPPLPVGAYLQGNPPNGPGQSWTFAGSSGVAKDGGGANGSFEVADINYPGQYAFLQLVGSVNGRISQTVNFTSPGLLVLSFLEAGRVQSASGSGGDLNYTVKLTPSGGGNNALNVTNTSESDQPFRTQSHQFLIATPGDYTLSFESLSHNGSYNDNTALIDAVYISPEDVSGTYVSNTIVNQVWTAANSPYRVVGDIQVAGLTIQPGVTVLFASNYVFVVAGKLKAIGTPDLPVLFTATYAGWQGIFFNAAQPGCELAHCIIEKSVNSGIRIVNSAPSISDCIIRGNGMSMDVWQSGTVSVELNGAGIKTDSSLVLDNCTIQNNSSIVRVRANDASAIARGGGVYSTAPLKLLNCTISSNSLSAVAYLTGSGPGSAFCEGGGVWAGTNLTVQNCLITGNSVNADCTTVGGPSLTSSLGGGILSQGQLLQRNSIIAGNTAAGEVGFGRELKLKGGGAYIRGKLSSIENCTIAFNNPDGLATDTNGTQVISSIVWGNVTNQIVGTTNVAYSDVQGGMAGLGNISGSPIFLSSGDLIIVPGSPCINRGSTNAAYTNIYFPPSIGRGRSDMGAHGGPGAGARLRARFSQQLEVVFLGGVPGYNYQIQASTDFLNWQTVKQVRIAHLGDYASFLEPITNPLPFRFYRLNLGP